MRCLLVGLFIFFHPVLALGQATGQVLDIGFQKHYRPDCWTPMLVQLTPDSASPQSLMLQVKQEDMDRDHPIYTRLISLTGATDSKARDQKFLIYFKPQPTDSGLPDANDPGRGNAKDLAEQLQVSLTTPAGKFISTLPITTSIINVDHPTRGTGTLEERLGTHIVLAVTDPRSTPAWRGYEQVLGLLEEMTLIAVQPGELPESVLGYDAIDTILWIGADPAALRAGGDEKYRAIESFVRRGGHLVICTTSEWQKIQLGLTELLPVMIQGTQPRSSPEPLSSYAIPVTLKSGNPQADDNAWDKVTGPFITARATAKPGAIVEDWLYFDNEKNDAAPFLVRRGYGNGAVTWVAQDLGDPFLLKQAKLGWPRIWDRVLSIRNRSQLLVQQTPEEDRWEFAPASGIDVGRALLPGLELTSKSAWLVTLAVVFFIGYWLLAGPGVFVYLLGKRRTNLSWFMFGASALIATGITVVLVKATLRGKPQLRHVTLVKQAKSEPAVIYSRFGIYIPRDGEQTIEIKNAAPDTVTTLTALSIHPLHIEKPTDRPGPEYSVMVREPGSTDPAMLKVPYRSTLKKFEADWTGDAGGAIEGSAKITDDRTIIEGLLVNGTGKPLRDIYLAFRYDTANTRLRGDWVLYIPRWDAGQSIDLQKTFNTDEDGKFLNLTFRDDPNGRNPGTGKRVRDRISDFWQTWWTRDMRGNTFNSEEQMVNWDRALPVLSFYGRFEPSRNPDKTQPVRFEFLRRGGRRFDVSNALEAGGLVVVAQADEVPLPMPLEVEGEKTPGAGRIVYQTVIPMERPTPAPPSTQPEE